MSFLRIYDFSRLSYLLVLIMTGSLVACAGGGDSGAATATATATNALSLNWTAPSEREDGSVMNLSEIAGYRIYYGTETGNYQNQLDINDSSAVQAKISEIPSDTYYVVVTVVDTDGRESSYSSEVVVTL